MGNDVHADVHEISGRPLAEQARVLLEINNAIVSHLDLAQVLNAVSACLRREINHDFSGVALCDACAGALRNLVMDLKILKWETKEKKEPYLVPSGVAAD